MNQEIRIDDSICNTGSETASWASIQERKVRLMLTHYRSRDLTLVSAAADWFVQIDVRRTIEHLALDLNSDNPVRRDEVKSLLAAFNELAFKQVLDLLDDPDRYADAVEVLAAMDGHVVQHLIRHLDRPTTFNLRAGVLTALTAHLNHPAAISVLANGLRDPDPLFQALVCQALLERGPSGQQILERVFPSRVCVAA